MISYLKGVIAEKSDGGAVVDVGGIGFCVSMPALDASLLPNEGSEAKIYTYLHVQEDAMRLFGFADRSGIESFEKLLSVNGVGCKAALSILSVLSPQNLAAAIVGEDAKAICQAQGVGLKMAQRIILELKGKVSAADALRPAPRGDSPTPSADVSAINALIALGSSPSEAQKTVMKINAEGKSLTTEEIIKEALRRMANGL